MNDPRPFPVADPLACQPHLTPANWARANLLLLVKALSEFAHERLLSPEGPMPDGGYRLARDRVEYRFRARRLALDHWLIDPSSLVRRLDGVAAGPDVLAFVTEFRAELGLSDEVMPLYLDEISSTLYSSAFKLASAQPDARQLCDADFQTLEGAMTEGHPVFIANNGRIGFDDAEWRVYTPEAARPMSLVWLAVDRRHACFSHIDGLDHERLMQEELGPDLAGFRGALRQQGLDPDGYWLMPAHPWQWHNRLATAFAAEIAARRIVYLGRSADAYRPQQSIRTCFNLSRPLRRYVKTALSILNMGFMRGLSPCYMQATPAINQWLKTLVDGDPYLGALGFDILREEAAIGYRNPYYEAALPGNGPHKKQLAALWRESPVGKLRPGERLMTMAALLHRDRDGQSLVAALIRAAGGDARDWLRSYLRAYLHPVLHCFYRHDLVFMPHGENVILILDRYRPVRVLMKDIAEEIALFDPARTLPAAVHRIAVDVPENLRVLSIFTDVFDCFFRHLAALLDQDGICPQSVFWNEVAGCVGDYQAAMPALADRFVRHDLFAPRFARSCLNRLQLANNRQMVDLADPAGSLRFAGELDNPLAAHRPTRAR